jgi:hypothetical protein
MVLARQPSTSFDSPPSLLTPLIPRLLFPPSPHPHKLPLLLHASLVLPSSLSLRRTERCGGRCSMWLPC